MSQDSQRRATFRFHGELRDFLPAGADARPREYWFSGTPSIKDAIEAQGVPHPEVEAILVAGRAVDFSCRLRPADDVAVFPAGSQPERPVSVRLRPPLPLPPRFVLDVNLGKLARLLRLLGFDCLYRNDFTDPQVARLSQRESRAVLTRDRRLLHQKIITHGYWVRSDDPETQVREVIARFALAPAAQPVTRCLDCNGLIRRVDKQEVLHRLEPMTKRYYDDFYQCEDCGKVYWNGSHAPGLNAKLVRVLAPD